MAGTRADFDDLVWDRNEEEWEREQPKLRHRSAIELVEKLVTEKLGSPATWVAPMNIGGYNIVYRLRVEDLPFHVIVRRPILCYAQFPREKTPIEAATNRYIEENTMIPTASFLFHGESPELGNYLIMKYVEHKRSMSTALNATNEDTNKTFVLDPNIPEAILEGMYSKVASCLLELWRHKFPKIGSLSQTEDGTFSISSRPITRNMNDMLQLAGIPRSVLPLPETTYCTADDYYIELANMHIAQLVFQHNDLVTSADDCRNKYVARQIFRKLAREGKLSTFGFKEDTWSAQSKTMTVIQTPVPQSSGAFPLYCDDLRAGNILLNENDDIAGIIDWEYTYAAPAQFSLDPPWWLVLDSPDQWDDGIESWCAYYEPRLKIWLRAMKKAEIASEDSNTHMKTEIPLSTSMQESWQTGRFWLSYAARQSWAFDAFYWKFLDERFFGARELEEGVSGLNLNSSLTSREGLWKCRVGLLSVEEREAMDGFVEKKMEEGKERRVVEWRVEEARKRLDAVLLD